MEVLSAPRPLTPTPADLYRYPPTPPATVQDSAEDATSTRDVDQSDFFPTSPECTDNESSDNAVQRPYPLPPPSTENKVLAEDVKTPDNHVPRDPRLIRLTGIHPFNVEAPLTELFNEGFITTKDLHYVRNHGYVPKVDDSEYYDWTFSVEGMVEKPVVMSVRQLIDDYEQVTYPITLVCAGNRRKEQNIVRKSKGFSWGPAGVSTALWTGVALGDLIRRARPKRGARYVCFEGADKLPNGYYGTSVKLNWAVDSERGMMASYLMNGERLHPDHGKPLRIVIPGQIGGRSVKWLKRIVVTADPSDNWYHTFDNRVLPTMVTPEASADMPETWKDERYAIYDLNTNSATACPAHEERLSLADPAASYKIRGYAYSGGGKRVTRVEVTLDKGKTWSLADINYPEDLYRLAAEDDRLYGGRVDLTWREASFCWCFWELAVPVSDLAAAQDVMVRAMDDAMMVQPRDMYWSVLGMMNNPWYRVVIHRERGEAAGGQDTTTLRFEHPCQPALLPGGWMERVKKAGGNVTNGFWGEAAPGEKEGSAAAGAEAAEAKKIRMTREGVDSREISLDELRAHDGEHEPWFVVDGHVYDGTAFLEGHPGGATSIFGAAGQDVSEEFMAIHSENAKAMMPKYHIGRLSASAVAALAGGADAVPAPPSDADPSSSVPVQRDVFLRSKAWTSARLQAKRPVSHDSAVFTFALEHAAQRVGLPVGQHLMMRLRAPAPGGGSTTTSEAILRAYTPISEVSDRGELNILIKIYKDDTTPAGQVVPGGKMTMALDKVPLGGTVDFKGPVGKFVYKGKGRCDVNGRLRRVRRFVMVCAGSGVTPIFQVLRAVVTGRTTEAEPKSVGAAAGESESTTEKAGVATTITTTDDGGVGDAPPDDEPFCLVLDGNRAESDILCRAELEALASSPAGRRRCRLVHTLTRPPAHGWAGLRGRMDEAFFRAQVGPPPPPTPEEEEQPAAEETAEEGGGAGAGAGAAAFGRDMVLVCGPKSLEESVKVVFMGMGWREEDLLFF